MDESWSKSGGGYRIVVETTPPVRGFWLTMFQDAVLLLKLKLKLDSRYIHDDNIELHLQDLLIPNNRSLRSNPEC